MQEESNDGEGVNSAGHPQLTQGRLDKLVDGVFVLDKLIARSKAFAWHDYYVADDTQMECVDLLFDFAVLALSQVLPELLRHQLLDIVEYWLGWCLRHSPR